MASEAMQVAAFLASCNCLRWRTLLLLVDWGLLSSWESLLMGFWQHPYDIGQGVFHTLHTWHVSIKMMDVVLHALNIVTYFLHVALHLFHPILMGCHQWQSHMETKGAMAPQKFEKIWIYWVTLS